MHVRGRNYGRMYSIYQLGSFVVLCQYGQVVDMMTTGGNAKIDIENRYVATLPQTSLVTINPYYLDLQYFVLKSLSLALSFFWR